MLATRLLAQSLCRFQFSLPVITILLIHSFPVIAVSFFTNVTAPIGLSSACTDALIANVDCSLIVPQLRSGSYYPESTLTRACTSGCTSALATYQNNILAACGTETWVGYEGTELPVVMIPDMMRYHLGLVCLKDNERWCNNIAAAYAMDLDPAGINPITGDTSPINIGTNTTSPCDLCFIKSLRVQAGSPYYDGPLLAENSIYESKTSSCSITGYPLTTTILSFYTPVDPPDPDPISCDGTEYTITSGDTCHSISLSEGISTGWLLADNQLTAGCANFPTTGTLCLVNTCDVYTVLADDTCESIAASHSITISQFLSWNPSINGGCYNLIPTMIGHQVCISVPGRPFITPPPTTLAPSIPLTPAPVPTDIADDTNSYCGRYYKAILGDFCYMIVIKFGLSLDDFIFLNPAINQNCTNLFADESYCVQAVGDIKTYSGHPGSAIITTITSHPLTRNIATLPDADYTTPPPAFTEAPISPGSREDCAHFFDGADFQFSLVGTNFKSQCEFVAQLFGVSLEELGVWNPQLGDTTIEGCGFSTGVRYCGRYFFVDAYVPPAEEETLLPIRENAISTCTEYFGVGEEDGYTCADVLEEFQLTIAQFYAMNPAVQADCSGLWLGYRYCVRDGTVTETTTTSDVTSAPTPTPSGPPGPVQPGQPEDCIKWHVAVAEIDNCATVTSQYFITLAQFLLWNPAVSSDCSSGFWANYAYCVGVPETISSTRSSSTAPTAPTPIPIPDPHQENNAISNCNKYAQAEAVGDYCYAFAERNSISVEDLYSWNAVLGSDGSGCSGMFWANYWYCVGVSE